MTSLPANDNVIPEKAPTRLELTRIGNSPGIRIPKPLIAQCGLGEVVRVRVTKEGLVIAPLVMAGSRPSLRPLRPKLETLLDSASPNAFDTRGSEMVSYPRRGEV